MSVVFALSVMTVLAAAVNTGPAQASDKQASAVASSDNKPKQENAWLFDDMAEGLRALSCPDASASFPFSPLEITAASVELGAAVDVMRALPEGVSFAGGWHLTATSSDFGGLSGLDITEGGDLLAISDAGAFFIIGLNGGVPDGRGSMSYMRSADGEHLTGKTQADAEGLAYHGGLAFVSFERNHRILAYNLAGCESAARGALVAHLPDVLGGNAIKPNNGPEALMLSAVGRLITGYETLIDDRSWLLTVGERGGALGEVAYLDTPNMFKLVGADDSVYLMRAYDPLNGNRSHISLAALDITFQLSPPLNVDNFEGIVLGEAQNGVRRLYIISDDNFSSRQRTLLYAFDIAAQ